MGQGLGPNQLGRMPPVANFGSSARSNGPVGANGDTTFGPGNATFMPMPGIIGLGNPNQRQLPQLAPSPQAVMLQDYMRQMQQPGQGPSRTDFTQQPVTRTATPPVAAAPLLNQRRN